MLLLCFIEETEAKPVLSASQFLKTNAVQLSKARHDTTALQTRTKSSAAAATSEVQPNAEKPVLGRGLNCDDEIVFDDENVPLNFTKVSSGNPDKAKVSDN